MALGDDTLTFRAKALAQAHPLTAGAEALIGRLVDREAATQPVAEIGRWAGTAMLTGYCLRVVEEERAGVPAPADHADLDRLDSTADSVIAELRSGAEDAVVCDESDDVIAALDAIIAGEIDRHVDPWRERVGADAWRSLEDYIAHFAVKGYAIRVAETKVGDQP